MKKAIFFDIDGTLVDCINGIEEITPRVKKAMRALQERGHYIFIASGRPFAFLSEAIRNFGFDGFVLANGSQVIVRDKCIYVNKMDKGKLREFVCSFEKLNIEYILQGEKYSYIKDSYKKLHDLYNSYFIPKKYLVGDYNLEEIDALKIEMLCRDKKGREYCLSLKKDNFLNYYGQDANAFELSQNIDSKATGILKVLEYLKIPIENSYAFGDGRNDVEMLSKVGYGIAMGNAEDYVKSFAKKVTDTVQNDGVAVEIENFILY